jgi:hypothetical protein
VHLSWNWKNHRGRRPMAKDDGVHRPRQKTMSLWWCQLYAASTDSLTRRHSLHLGVWGRWGGKLSIPSASYGSSMCGVEGAWALRVVGPNGGVMLLQKKRGETRDGIWPAVSVIICEFVLGFLCLRRRLGISDCRRDRLNLNLFR